MIRRLLCTLPLLLLAAPSAADSPAQTPSNRIAHDDFGDPIDPREILSKANRAFDAALAAKNRSTIEEQRLLREALEHYEILTHIGIRNGPLYYNIANTHLRLGQLGRAILNYRRALRFAPGDPNIRKNYEVARRMCEIRIDPPPTSALFEAVFFWHYGTSLASRLNVALTAYALFWSTLIAALFLPARPIALTWTARALLALNITLAISITVDLSAASRPEAVTTQSNITLRKGNGESYEPQLQRPLPEGIEFQILETRPDYDGAPWYHIQLPDHKQGWLRANQSEII